MAKDLYSQKILILDFGSQYTQLIARRVREAQVYCEIHPFNLSLPRIRAFNPKGIILSGGPSSIYDKDAPIADARILDLNVPVLGICYGMQYLTHVLGGVVAKAEDREYGSAGIKIRDLRSLFHSFSRGKEEMVWMSHGDRIEKMPEGFKSLAGSKNSPVAAMADPSRKFFGVQFHPEVAHTPRGMRILKNFLFKICGCEPLWTMSSFVERTIQDLQTANRQGKSHLRGLGRGGFHHHGGPSPQGCGRSALSDFCGQRPAEERRKRRGGGALSRPLSHPAPCGGCVRAFSREAQRSHGPGAEAQDHRPGIHHGVSRKRPETWERRSSWPKARSTRT